MMPMRAAISRDSEFRALAALSARLGRDRLRTQAAGGNTSLKRDGLLWIKASGTWLAEAQDRDIMVPVRLAPLMAAFERGDAAAEKAADFVVVEANPSGLRPSIETTAHAVIPRPVVVHIHCVETIAIAVRADAEHVVCERLRGIAGVHWDFVPYRRPGLPLARAIAERLRPQTNVLILANHGLVVAAATVAEAEQLVERVCAALSAPAREAPVPDLDRLAALARGSGYRLPSDPSAHALALDPQSLRIAAGGSLYPDHVIFLGPGTSILEQGASLDRLEAPPLHLAVPGVGVLLHGSVGSGADEMLRCLCDVTARIGVGTPVVYLTPEDEDALMNWDAEKYRQTLAKGRS